MLTHSLIRQTHTEKALDFILTVSMCARFQPGVQNMLDVGLERPNSFSSRVTLVSEFFPSLIQFLLENDYVITSAL